MPMRGSAVHRFHVAQHFGTALDKVRAQEHRGLVATQGSSPLTRTKYEWQKNASRLDNRSRRDFMALSRLNLKTARAWRIKETAAQLWDYSYRGSAQKAWKNPPGWILPLPSGGREESRQDAAKVPLGVLNAIAARSLTRC